MSSKYWIWLSGGFRERMIEMGFNFPRFSMPMEWPSIQDICLVCKLINLLQMKINSHWFGKINLLIEIWSRLFRKLISCFGETPFVVLCVRQFLDFGLIFFWNIINLKRVDNLRNPIQVIEDNPLIPSSIQRIVFSIKRFPSPIQRIVFNIKRFQY